MSLDKNQILDRLIAQLEQDLSMTKEAARATYDAATNEESKPENEYDTRALEASYLAGAQAKRAGELDFAIAVLKKIPIKKFGPSDEISSTALVILESAGKQVRYFLLPLGGGFSITLEGNHIQVVTPTSQLGDSLIGLRVGEIAEVEIGTQLREFKVVSIE